MGYAWGGTCHQTTTAALARFTADMTDGNSSGINTFTAAPTISAGGVITWSISNRPLSTTTATTRTGTTALPTCTSDSVDQWATQSILLIVALFFAAIAGFRTGFRP
jgi:hypothetical protein